MRRIDRPNNPGCAAALATAHATYVAPHVAHHAATGESPDSAAIRAITGYRVALDELVTAQYGKCAWCEWSVQKRSQPIDHWRPKSHYWWLAFEWDNLLFSCFTCNSTCKSSHFEVDGVKAVDPSSTLPAEDPRLIDPANEDPIDHIRFRRAPSGRFVAFGRHGSLRGNYTAKLLGLSREELQRLYRQVDRMIGLSIDAFRAELSGGVAPGHAWRHVEQHVASGRPVAGFAYDRIDELVPSAERAQYGVALPRP